MHKKEILYFMQFWVHFLFKSIIIKKIELKKIFEALKKIFDYFYCHQKFPNINYDKLKNILKNSVILKSSPKNF